MKRALSLAICTTLAACSMLNPAPALSQESTVSLDDIVLLAQSNISDQTIMTFLWYRQLDFVLDAKGIERLRAGGVSDDIIQYLLEQDDTAIASVPAYVVPTGYRTAYPSYYYGARLVGTTVFPLDWYNHHYFGIGHSTVYSYPHHYSRRHSLGHSVGITLGHDRHRLHVPSLHGRNHLIRHGGHSLGHSGGHRRGHSGGHRRGHSGGHGGGHGGEH